MDYELIKENLPQTLIRYRDETPSVSCPYGEAIRIITGGEGGVANIHVIRITKGDIHFHSGYHEIYYVLSGNGYIILNGERHRLKSGAAVVIPSGVTHEIIADNGEVMEFVIVGTPAMSVDDPRFIPQTPDRGLFKSTT